MKRDRIPIACNLTSEELRMRETNLLAEFKSRLTTIEELPDGYAFRVPGEKRSLELGAQLLIAERECCPFLTFQITAEPQMGPLTIRITGLQGSKEFLRSIFVSGLLWCG